MKKILIKILLGILLLTSISTVSYYFTHPNISQCFLIGFSDFDQIKEGIYVSPETPADERNLLLEVVTQSEARIKDFWGAWTGTPHIIYCHTQEDYDTYGSHTPGVAYLNPFATYIVISPRGLRTDIMSHEMCHVELFTRIGWWASEHEKPTWFDEGLALMLDYRYSKRERRGRYFGFLADWDRGLKAGEDYLPLQSLQTLEDFSQGDLKRQVFAYITSGMEVSRWLEVVGKEGLHEFVAQIADGGEFPQTYSHLESSYKKQANNFTNR